MRQATRRKSDVQKAVDVVRSAGGKIVGRTRLQKIAFLLEAAGLGDGFAFEYRHYGPYSEELADAVRYAGSFGLLHEEERPTSWGGFYSVFTTGKNHDDPESSARRALASKAAEADPIALELAATAAYLALEGEDDPWQETAMRKPEKAGHGRLEKAKALYESLRQIDPKMTLPDIVSF